MSIAYLSHRKLQTQYDTSPIAKSTVPSNDGRLGEIISGGDDDTAALPLDDEGRDRGNAVVGLDDGLEGVEGDELYELSAAFRFPGIGTAADEDIVWSRTCCKVDV